MLTKHFTRIRSQYRNSLQLVRSMRPRRELDRQVLTFTEQCQNEIIGAQDKAINEILNS